MAILIADDECATRKALREILSALGHRVILEAKDGLEAKKILDTVRLKIRLIIADREMPYLDGLELLAWLEQKQELNLIPYLLITSDLPRTKLTGLLSPDSRLDSLLTKPFRQVALERAIQDAVDHRAEFRNRIVVLGLPPPPGLTKALLPHESLICVQTPRELQKVLSAGDSRIGAALIEPSLEPRSLEWLIPFKKTPIGSATPIVCLGKDPSKTYSMRTVSQFYIDHDDENQESWRHLLKKLKTWARIRWQMELMRLEAKAAIQEQDYSKARRVALRMLKLDADNSEAHCLYGEILASLNQHDAAIKHFVHSLQINPCSPRPYLKIMGSIPEKDQARRDSLVKKALAYCPGSMDILTLALKTRTPC